MAINRGPATRKACRRCANLACRKFFRPDRPTRRFCSRQCSADVRPRSARVAWGRKGGTNSGVARRVMSVETIRQRTAGMTALEAFLLGRKYGKADRGNRVTTARREGYSEGYTHGYEAATKDFRWRTA